MSAIISYRPNTQKIHNGFKNTLTQAILGDICFRITGQSTYTVCELNDTYNKGRLLTLSHNNITHYITLSECRIDGRNSSLQSVPTAINVFFADPNPNKKLWYYFVPHTGNPFTDYHLVYYRLMMTAGIEFLNLILKDYCLIFQLMILLQSEVEIKAAIAAIILRLSPNPKTRYNFMQKPMEQTNTNQLFSVLHFLE